MIKWDKLLIFTLVSVFIIALAAVSGQSQANKINLGLDLQGGFEILYQAVAENEEDITRENLKSTVASIEERINRLGVAEPSIDIEANNRIRVQLAGIEDQDEARSIIGTTAKLEFVAPDGKVVMTGQDLKTNAKYAPDQMNQPTVAISFIEASLFADVTKTYLNQVLAIVLDGEVISAPRIQTIISDGSAVITGMSSVAEANRLALLLNSGSLPLELEEINSTSVGASLGQIALEKAIIALMIGSILIALYMVIYYRVPGIVAVISLVAYVYLVITLFVLFGFTMTLPGIAAVLLGIGMAVDANILTYERVREELKNGKSILSSVISGSKKSLVTILDANITTILAAAVLFIFGSGTIKGFALTLIISIVVSMFTAVLISRWLLLLLAKSNIVTNPRWFGAERGELK